MTIQLWGSSSEPWAAHVLALRCGRFRSRRKLSNFFRIGQRFSSMWPARLYRLQSMPDSFRHVSRRRARPKRLDSAGEVVQSSPPAARRKKRPPFCHSLVRHK
jgi:hypothetical protein